MCGIFACFNPDGIGNISAKKLEKSTKVAYHRGPDNTGFYSDNYCFLGHTRLSIVGTAESGNQPFQFNDLVISYNGEIFNYIELRKELVELGYSFTTTSDTEVVIKAFDCWGPECFSKFNGMWALVIYDSKSHVLTVSRDRFGQKPLFVSRVDGAYFFSSEAHQIYEHTKRKINFNLIQAFLKEGGYEGKGQTFFEEIEDFPKAHYFTLSLVSEGVSSRYWCYPTGDVSKTTQSSLEEFEVLLRDAVKIRLRADVPFGVLLSGGVDSTIIASIIRDITGPKLAIPAYTYASGDRHDESVFAAAVAERLGMTLTFREQDKIPTDYVKRLKNLVHKMGRGHSSPAVVSVDYLYDNVSKNGIRVAIDGQGADELLAGYKIYYPQIIFSQIVQGRFQQAYMNIKSFIAPGGQMEYGFLSAVLLYLRTILPPAARSVMRRLYGYEKLFCPIEKKSNEPFVRNILTKRTNINALNRLLQKQHELGLENLLYYGDIVAMNNSVENRSPFMDHRLVEFCFNHDELLKVHDGKEKFALRNLELYKRFRDVLDRDKIGFSSDISKETKELMLKQLILSPILGWPIFSKNLEHFLNSKRALQMKYERILFRLFQVHLWNEVFCNDATEE